MWIPKILNLYFKFLNHERCHGLPIEFFMNCHLAGLANIFTSHLLVLSNTEFMRHRVVCQLLYICIQHIFCSGWQKWARMEIIDIANQYLQSGLFQFKDEMWFSNFGNSQFLTLAPVLYWCHWNQVQKVEPLYVTTNPTLFADKHARTTMETKLVSYWKEKPVTNSWYTVCLLFKLMSSNKLNER